MGSFRELNLGSGMSSPLTSLSSLDDLDERQLPGLSSRLPDPEDLKAAQVNTFTLYLVSNSFFWFFAAAMQLPDDA